MKIVHYVMLEYKDVEKIQEELQEARYKVSLSATKITDPQHRLLTGHGKIHTDPAVARLDIEVPLPVKMRGEVEKEISNVLYECSETAAKASRNGLDPERLGKIESKLEFARYLVNQDPDNFITDHDELLDELTLSVEPDQLEDTIADKQLNKLTFEIMDTAPRFRGTFESLSLNAQTELRRTVRNGKLESVTEKLNADTHNLANHFFSRSDMIEILGETYSRCKPALSKTYIEEKVDSVIYQFEHSLSWFQDEKNDRSWDSLNKLKPAQSVQPFDIETMEKLKQSMIRTANANGDLTRLAKKLYPRTETQEAIAMTRADINKGEVLLPVSKETLAKSLMDILHPKKSIGKDSKGVEREELYIYDHSEGIYTPNAMNLIKKAVNHWAIGNNGLQLKDTQSIYLLLLTGAEEIDLIAEIERVRKRYFPMKNCLVEVKTLTPEPYTPDHFVLTKHPSPFVADFENLPVPSYTLENGDKIHADQLLRGYALNSDGTPNRHDELLLTQLLKAGLLPQLFAFRPNVFLKGVTGGGKSAYIGLLNSILGGLGAPADLTSLDEQNFPLEHTIGARAVIQEEMPIEGFSGGVKTLKSMTSGGEIEVKRKGLPSLIASYANTAIFLASNHPIIFRDMDEIGKIMRRFTFAAFEHTIENQDEQVHLWIQNDRELQTWFTNYILRVEVPKERIVTERSERLIAETIKGDPFNDFVLDQLEEGENDREPAVFSMYLAYAVKQCAANLPFLEYNAFYNKLKATLVIIKQSFGKGVEASRRRVETSDFDYLESISNDFALLTPTQRKSFLKGIEQAKKVLKTFPDLPTAIDEITFQDSTAGELAKKEDSRLMKLVHK